MKIIKKILSKIELHLPVSMPIIESELDKINNLLEHIIAMEDDSYLIGHPEFNEIVKEAKKLTLDNQN